MGILKNRLRDAELGLANKEIELVKAFADQQEVGIIKD